MGITKGSYILIINDDGSITDNNINLRNQETTTSVTLTRVGVVDEFSLADRLGSSFL